MPDWGLLYTLPQRVGLPAARRMLVAGEVLSGLQAGDVALADEVVADSDVMTTAVRRAAEYAKLPRAAFARMKRRFAFPSNSLDEELGREEEDQARLLQGAEFCEGYAAYQGKRAADFAATAGIDP